MEAGPSPQELDEAEIQIRTLLFRLGTGLGQEEVAPSVHRRKEGVAVEGVISSAERRALVKAELEAIPHALDQLTDRVAPASVTRLGEIDSARAGIAVTVQPPQLRDTLIRRMGGEEAATDFANRILSDSGKLFALAVQLHELAKRYSPAEMDAAPSSVSSKVAALVEQVDRAIVERLHAEDRMLSPVLGERSSGTSSEAGGPWQDRAQRVFRLASMHEKLLSRLFAVTGNNAEDGHTAEWNLRQLETVREELASLAQ
jgi:hypothetical protein